MQFIIKPILVLGILLFAACSPLAAPISSPTPTPDPTLLLRQLAQRVRDGAQMVEDTPPPLPLPDDIQPEQVRKYFRLDQDFFALVLLPTSNIPLNTGQAPTFNGILIAPANATRWKKFLILQVQDPGAQNNPYWLWTDRSLLHLAVVDHLGAGSGEGIMKLMTLDAKGNWNLAQCYYFGGKYRSGEQDGDYLAFASKLDRQEPLPFNACANWGAVVPVNSP